MANRTELTARMSGCERGGEGRGWEGRHLIMSTKHSCCFSLFQFPKMPLPLASQLYSVVASLQLMAIKITVV